MNVTRILLALFFFWWFEPFHPIEFFGEEKIINEEDSKGIDIMWERWVSEHTFPPNHMGMKSELQTTANVKYNLATHQQYESHSNNVESFLDIFSCFKKFDFSLTSFQSSLLVD